jgi:hypothetical protein
MRIFIRIIILFFLLNPSYLLAVNDTTKNSAKAFQPSITKYFTQNQFESFDSTQSIDNSLYDFHKYISKNTLGNTGLPFTDQRFSPFFYPIGFNYYKNNYAPYLYSPLNLKFYNTRTPFTDLLYVMGTKREQLFKMIFSYNVKKNWNISADFLRIRSEGVYLRQNTNHNCLALSTNYKSENNRYWLLVSLAYNSFKNAENGGIADDSTFEESGSLDKKLLDINLSSAKKSVGNASAFLKQILNFGRRSNDTLERIIPQSRLILTSSMDANYFKYVDDNPASGYYSNIYYDSITTSDSTFFSTIENELIWKRLDNLKHNGFADMFGFGIGVKHQFIYVDQKESDTTFNNFIGNAEIYNTYSRNLFWWNLTAKYVAEGYNRGDYNSVLALKKQIKDSMNLIILRLESRLQEPDFIYTYYRSNNFLWNNEFEKTQKNSAEISFLLRKYDLGVNVGYSAYSNVLYFDNYAIARQFNKSLSVFSTSVKKDFVLYNWHLNNKITYQKVSDSSVVRLPELILEHSLYYENELLKKALNLQIGVSLFYNSAYYANAYMPATGQFYLQDNKKYGNYPFIDFFVNAQVKAVRIFFKIDHLNSGWSGNKYMLTPGYPYPDMTFKFGLSWKFFD